MASPGAGWQTGEILLGAYRVEALLGQGGMGRVFRVHHLAWDVDLAVKVPRPGTVGRAAELFTREAETWVRLALHPNVVACHYVRPIDGQPCVFIEYVEGGSLSEWIADRRLYAGDPGTALGRMLDAAIQFAWGLAHAHAHGLVHQDVKPANALLGAGGELKVTDFGLSRAVRAATTEAAGPGGFAPAAATSTGLTAAYASPEQARGEAVSRATDVWSWGVSVLEMFTGGTTWMSGTLAPAVLEQYLEDDPPAGVPAMPPLVAAMLRACFSGDPASRPASLLPLARDLAAAYDLHVGAPYPRAEPKALESRAPVLNNQALSLLDLGRRSEADAAWSAAVAADPHHPESVYNWGLSRWRRGEITDLDLVLEMELLWESAGRPSAVGRLLGLVHLERGDFEEAERILGWVTRQDGTDTEVADAYHAAAQGRELGLLHRLARPYGQRMVAISPAGRRAAVTGEDAREVDVLALGGSALPRLGGLAGSITVLAFNMDGSLAVTGSSSGMSADLWDVARGLVLRSYPGRLGRVTSVALSDDGRLAVIGTRQKPVALWDTQTGEALGKLEGHSGPVFSVALAGDGAWAITGSRDGSVRVWDTATRQLIWTLATEEGEVAAVALSRDGRRGFSARGGAIRVWDIPTGRAVRTLSGHEGPVRSLAASADGRWLVSASLGVTRVWDVRLGRCLRTWEDGGPPAALSADGVHAGSWCEGGVRLWTNPAVEDGRFVEVAHARQPGFLPVPWRLSRVREVAEMLRLDESARGLLAAAEASLEADPAAALAQVREARAVPGHERWPPSLELWRRLGARCRRTGLRQAWQAVRLAAPTPADTLALAAGCARAATASAESGVLRVWDLEEGKVVREWPARGAVPPAETPFGPVVALSADGKTVASAEAALALWDAGSGTLLAQMEGHTARVNSLDLSRDGLRLLSASEDGTLRLWDTGGRLLHVLAGHAGRVNVGVFSPDGRLAASGGDDGTVRVWDTGTGAGLRTLEGHTKRVTGLRVLPDGRRAVSASWDGTVRVWDLGTGACLVSAGEEVDPRERDPERVARAIDKLGHISLATGLDGRFAVTTGLKGEIRVWDLERGLRLSAFPGRLRYGRVDLTPDGWWLAASDRQGALALWFFDWELEAATPGSPSPPPPSAAGPALVPETDVLYCHFPRGGAWPRSVMRELWSRHPDTMQAFAAAGLFVIEFEAGSVDWGFQSRREVSRAVKVAFRHCPPHEGKTVLVLAHTSGDAYRDLAAGGLELPEGVFLGACGYIEGGVNFQGADGTFIASDDWTGARAYALRVAEARGLPAEEPPSDSRRLRNTDAARLASYFAWREAQDAGAGVEEPEHLFIAICELLRKSGGRQLEPEPPAYPKDVDVAAAWKEIEELQLAVERLGFDAGRAADELRGLGTSAVASPGSAWAQVAREVEEFKDPLVTLQTLWWGALIRRLPHLDKVLAAQKVSASDLCFAVAQAKEAAAPPAPVPPPAPPAPPPPPPKPAPPPAPVAVKHDEMARYGRDLTALARAGTLKPITGRDEEMKQVARILLRATKSNPILLGDAGVGKTAVVEGLAVRLLAEGIPPALRGLRLVEVSLGQLVAGADTRGVLEERVQELVKACERRPELVLFLDEVHALVGAGAARGGLDVSAMLKPALARGSIRCIGATTAAEYRRSIENDPALARRFQPVWIEEPSREAALLILGSVKARLEGHHGVSIEAAAVERALDLSIRHLPEARLPDKAIDLLDQACTRVLLSTFSTPSSRPLVVAAADVAEVVAERCRIPLDRLTADEAQRLLVLHEHLQRRIVGQEEAVRAVADTVRAARAGVRDPRRPLAVFLFVGPTGTGKTEMAKALAEFLFGDDRQLLRFDMSEYKEKHSVSRLVGAPPGYVGHDEGGQLTDAVRNRPYSVVLFDEIEKAHPEVLDLLLQVLDEGQLTDTHGRVARFHDAVIVMTSNLGAAAPGPARRAMGFAGGAGPAEEGEPLAERVQAALAAALRPELRNRIQREVLFRPLGPRDAELILDRVLQRLNATLQGRGVSVELEAGARALVLARGVSAEHGARALERAVHELVEVPLSKAMLEGAVGRLRVRAQGHELVVERAG